MTVSEAFIFHFKCYSILYFALCQLLCWAFLFYWYHHQINKRLQSANKVLHSTETAMTMVVKDLLTAVNGGKPRVLPGINATFDALDHDCTANPFRLTGRVFDLIRSHLFGCTSPIPAIDVFRRLHRWCATVTRPRTHADQNINRASRSPDIDIRRVVPLIFRRHPFSSKRQQAMTMCDCVCCGNTVARWSYENTVCC